jgi:hypothetical protein
MIFRFAHEPVTVALLRFRADSRQLQHLSFAPFNLHKTRVRRATGFLLMAFSNARPNPHVQLHPDHQGRASPSSRAPSRKPSPLRTVRETFASHGSSTQERPSEKQGRSLIQVQIRPTRYGLAANSHGNGYTPPDVCEAAPTACAVVICIASFIGSANVLEFEYHREVGSVSGEVMWSHKGNATSICPITGQHSLFLSSAIRITIDPPCGFTSPQGGRYGLTLFS